MNTIQVTKIHTQGEGIIKFTWKREKSFGKNINLSIVDCFHKYQTLLSSTTSLGDPRT
jgi:hypothetical protein